MTISGGKTKQLDIFRRITGFTSDFLSFIVVELIRFFHGSLKLFNNDQYPFHHSEVTKPQLEQSYILKYKICVCVV